MDTPEDLIENSLYNLKYVKSEVCDQTAHGWALVAIAQALQAIAVMMLEDREEVK